MTTFATRQLRLILVCFLSLGAPALAQDPASLAALKRAVALEAEGKWTEALEAAGAPGSVSRDIVEWQRLRAGNGTFAQTVDFLERRADWPGLDLLRTRSENAIPADAIRGDVLRFFAEVKPGTGTGALRYARALWETDQREAAMAEAKRAWTTMSLTASEEAQFMHDWPKTLGELHWERMDMLLWRGLSSQAERHMARVDSEHQALARARIGLRAAAAGVDGLIERVPAALADDAGLAYERFLWRANKGRNEDAIALLAERSVSEASLGRPDEWGRWRRTYARQLMRAGEYQTAYDIAANHYITEGWNGADSEWLAGYLALRYLDKPEQALAHFQKFRTMVDTPISLSRAGYFEGRAYEALGRKDEAQAAYTFGGGHETAFYGLLSAEKAGMPLDPALAGTEDFSGFEQASFWDLPIMEAARLAQALGDTQLTERFVIHLSERLDRHETGQLAAWAESVDAHYIALKIAKYNAGFGKVLEAAYFPVPEIGKGNPTVPRALELSIARRESEFNHVVKSPAGALGLMQLMPGTAKDMATRIGIPYEPAKLTTDPTYNVRLGSEYLAHLMERYGENPVLIAVGYNAGPGRANTWSDTNGDPRDPSVDVVDWVELIPFEETQTYVMRVTESLPIYEARLSGKAPEGPLDFTSLLKRK